jgi:hypothetical protein
MKTGQILLIILLVGLFIILPIVLMVMAFTEAKKIADTAKSYSGYCALTDDEGYECNLSTEDECNGQFFEIKDKSDAAMGDCLQSFETGGNETGGNETGGNETGGNETGGNETGGNETGGNETGG